MEAKKRNKKIDISKERSEKSPNSLQEEKDKLKKQISKLQSINLQLEGELDLYPFKNVKIDSTSNALDTIFDLDHSQIPDVDVDLELELFRFAGFHCLKFTEEEFILNLSPSNKYDKENIYALQVLFKNGNWSLGKWTMPMSIDLEDVVGQFSNDIKDVPNFVRTCRHYVNCYFIRCKQFNALKNCISCTKNSTLQTSDGYNYMMINLMGVYSTKDDDYTNAVIHIEYDIDETRPSQVDVELKNVQLNREAKEQFKKSVKCFKSMDLSVAFEKMWNNSPFTWSKEADEDSPIGMSNSDSSSAEEGFLKHVLEGATARQRQRKRKREDIIFSRSVHNSSEKKLKQVKPNLRSTKVSHAKPGTSKKLVTREKFVLHRNVDELITSTPMRRNDSIVMEMEDLDELSTISTPEKTESLKNVRKKKRSNGNN